jgi:asparagine synthase (glutamine-hydrolysing)
LFGSELKALAAHPRFVGEVDRDALALYLRHGYVPAPWTIYRGVRKVRPGCVVTLRAEAPAPVEERYWSAREVAERGAADPLRASDEEMVEQVDALLRQTVRREMVADVPLGAFLSGGVDSSTVVALMQAESARPVRTFTIGFAEPAYDESPWARAVATHLGTDHTELIVTAADARAVIPRLPALYDEPLADSSQIPTFLVAELARRHVTVGLSGDGGDELFGGYNRYVWGRRLAPLYAVPRPIRAAAARALLGVPSEKWNALLAALAPFLPVAPQGDKVHQLARVLSVDGAASMYRALTSYASDATALVPGALDPPPSSDPAVGGLVERMMLFDLTGYLPDDVMAKVDRATMGVSLESRAPLLDHRVVELAWRVPTRAKLRDGRGKWLLARLLDRYVPRALTERPKMGFGVPVGTWLRGPLREWASELLRPARLRDGGFLDGDAVWTKWLEHRSGRRSHANLLWAVLMFEAWRDAEPDQEVRAASS